ncbi:hypothetical protein BDW02DRAFT_569291 [Decorospora gaudefroyi]|uniref:Uncharacterized protein n=1 Tax=Decorospora gaudefroyi TaxID=184978 RepID=A0A6A5KCT7_9PLEO|nr:hypothetical protein BDW02DRAFT_569291 [Decorospora gaudefroyi]
MGDRDTPPCSGPNTQTPQTPLPEVAGTIASPRSIVTTSPDQAAPSSTVPIPKNPTQTLVEADPQLKRLQQDLLVLSSLNENSTLHWRPSWFAQEPFSKQFWTLQNPPNVVTEKLPSTVPQGREYYTRRMRREDDAPPYYIKSWEHWERYCEMYGIPQDFLCKEQVELIRVGLPRDKKGMLCRTCAEISMEN